MIRLSVIIPAYNCEKYIGRCLDSILNQENLEFEIIVINDGSTDNTLKICRQYEEKFENIKVINKKNEGQGIARNVGILEAKGKYITFVDSDDYVNQNCYTLAISILEKNSADFFAGQIKKISEGESENLLLDEKYITYHNYSMSKDDLVKSMLAGNDIEKNSRVSSSTCDKIYLKSIIEKYKIVFVSERIYLSEDIIFNIMFLDKCNICIVSNMEMYNYVTNVASFCHTYQSDYITKMYKMIDVFNSYRFGFSDQEYKALVSEKMYGYIKSYMFQEVEHQNIYNSAKHIKKICQEPRIIRIFSSLEKKKFSLIDYFIVFFSKLQLGVVIAFFYKLKLMIFRVKNISLKK